MIAEIADIESLEDILSEPTEGVCQTISQLEGDVLVLGAAGKMGVTLSRMLKRASLRVGRPINVCAASRFSAPGSQTLLESWGVDTRAGDLLSEDFLKSLPKAPYIFYLSGMKFGASQQEALTWAMNAYLPGKVCERFSESRIVAFSTGNVYPLSPVALGGSVESDPTNPVGEYAMSCLGRERIFEHFSRTLGTPITILRLNYAVELRYGVLCDIAQKVYRGEPVDLTMGCVNALWQGSANAYAIQSLLYADSPPTILNLAGAETASVRRIAEQFGEWFGKPPKFTGEEASTALLNNAQKAHALFGYPSVPLHTVLQWAAQWTRSGKPTLGKPTRFETRDGKF